MSTISKYEFGLEKKRLKTTLNILDNQMSKMGSKIFENEEKYTEFKRYAWDNKSMMDEGEFLQVKTSDELMANRILMEKEYFRKVYQIKDNPYFGSFIFENKEKNKMNIYIGMTYLKDNEYGNIIYDWRSPIASLFYDYEVGSCSYIAPEGPIEGELLRKRQYKIINRELISAFDNSLNIDDTMLQEVLANDSDDKMKNIVNTIQKEQNSVIRNTKDKTLIVSGIAGSGKTSVALHRIAFLLYKIKNLHSNDVLIFSPNNVFTEYISNVLPELGENNTMQTTFNEYLQSSINEFHGVQSFMEFLGEYYSNNKLNHELIKYKQSDQIIKDITLFVESYIKNNKVLNSFTENKIYNIDKKEVNEMIHDRYKNLPFFERIDTIAEKLSENNYKGSTKKKLTYRKLIINNSNFSEDYKSIYLDFFQSDYCKIRMNDKEIKEFNNKKIISYEDALLFVYLKCLLRGFPYEKNIKHVVIDEAQDYSILQYIIINKIFRNSNFTILGDVNQTINPYYKYDTLDILSKLFKSSKCISLEKTYRSSPEIIDFSNKILGLKHVCAIRNSNKTPIIQRKNGDYLLKDIEYLQKKYKSTAIITRDTTSAQKLYDRIKNNSNISLLTYNSEKFNKKLVILPAYLAKGLEFDSVIVYCDENSKYQKSDKNILYVACTRAQHELIIYS